MKRSIDAAESDVARGCDEAAEAELETEEEEQEDDPELGDELGDFRGRDQAEDGRLVRPEEKSRLRR